jgi:hypothetical protein
MLDLLKKSVPHHQWLVTPRLTHRIISQPSGLTYLEDRSSSTSIRWRLRRDGRPYAIRFIKAPVFDLRRTQREARGPGSFSAPEGAPPSPNAGSCPPAPGGRGRASDVEINKRRS